MAFLLAAVLLAACQFDIDQVKMQGVEKHANGLTMPVPEGFSAKPTSKGFEVTQNGQLRTPLGFHVMLVRNQTPMIARKYLGLFGPYERIKTEEAVGSSGANHRLVLWQATGSCWIVLTAQHQTQFGTSSFLPARAAAARSSVAAESGC